MDAASIHLITQSHCRQKWVCWHHLLQFIFGKWWRIQCSNLFKLFVKDKFNEHFHFSCIDIDSPSTIFACTLYRSWAPNHFGFVYALILGYAVRIFHTTDAKYMFHVGWCKSLKGSATPVLGMLLFHTVSNFGLFGTHVCCHIDSPNYSNYSDMCSEKQTCAYVCCVMQRIKGGGGEKEWRETYSHALTCKDRKGHGPLPEQQIC